MKIILVLIIAAIAVGFSLDVARARWQIIKSKFSKNG